MTELKLDQFLVTYIRMEQESKTAKTTSGETVELALEEKLLRGGVIKDSIEEALKEYYKLCTDDFVKEALVLVPIKSFRRKEKSNNGKDK